MRRVRLDCCPRAPRGHVAAAPPSRVMNARRLMGRLSPEPSEKSQGRKQPTTYHLAVSEDIETAQEKKARRFDSPAKPRPGRPLLQGWLETDVNSPKRRGVPQHKRVRLGEIEPQWRHRRGRLPFP